MHSKLHLMSAFGVSFVLCLITTLYAQPLVAGVNRWTAISPDGANVAALAVDPRIPTTVFAGTVGSGVLKSTDGGASWATANGSLPTLNVSALAINPATTSTLYAGTDAGVFTSANGGQSWAPANGGLIGAAQTINALAIDSGSPFTLYAVTSGGVFKTVDGAANWTPISAGLVGLTPRVIVIDPISSSTIYVGADDYEDGIVGGVFKSTDAGTSWKRVYTLPFAEDYQYSAAVIAIDPVLPSRMYLALDFGGAMRSLDGGTSWSDLPPITELRSLAIDPASPATLYAGTYSGAVFQSFDAGDHWTPVTGSPLASGSVNVLAVAPSAPTMVYAGGRTGIFQTSGNAQPWIHLALGVRSIGVYPLAVDPTNSSTIYTAIGTGFVTKTTDGGIHWSDSVLGVGGQSVNSFAIDPATPATVYAAMGWSNSAPGSAVYKSLDGGVQWAPASNGLPTTYISALAIAPSRTSTLYAGSIPGGVSKSVDGGSSWTRTNNGISGVALNVSALAIDPTNADIVYVATPPSGVPNIDAKFFKSTDGAAQWRQVAIGIPSGSSVTSVVVDPATPAKVYATYGDYGEPGVGGVFTSSDGGETWVAPQNLLPTVWNLALAIDADSHSQIYASTRNGVFRSSDSAVTWTPLNSGLSNLDISSLATDRTGSLLRVATQTGLFEYRLAGGQSTGTVALIEYVNAALGDYFITSIPNEISKLDSGAFAGWERTGFQFNAYAAPSANSALVCRFFSAAFAPKSTHFYTPFSAECTSLRTNPKWLLESTAAFAIAVPGPSGSCATGLAPVYRFYNNGRGGAPNHRYTTDLVVREQMIAQGWVPEGVGPNAVQMCSPP